jgi:hypothetical protein
LNDHRLLICISREPRSNVADEQRVLIESLIKSNQESAARYKELQQNMTTTAFNTMLMAHTSIMDASEETSPPAYKAQQLEAPTSRSPPDTTATSKVTGLAVTASRSIQFQEAPAPVVDCLCGNHQKSNQGKQDFQHLTPEDLAVYEKRLGRLIEQITHTQKMLGRLNLPNTGSCSETHQHYHEAKVALERILVGQNEAYAEKQAPVAIQEIPKISELPAPQASSDKVLGSFLRDDSVKPTKITLSPNKLRDDGPSKPVGSGITVSGRYEVKKTTLFSSIFGKKRKGREMPIQLPATADSASHSEDHMGQMSQYPQVLPTEEASEYNNGTTDRPTFPPEVTENGDEDTQSGAQIRLPRSQGGVPLQEQKISERPTTDEVVTKPSDTALAVQQEDSSGVPQSKHSTSLETKSEEDSKAAETRRFNLELTRLANENPLSVEGKNLERKTLSKPIEPGEEGIASKTKARITELKKSDSSMFAVHVSNPKAPKPDQKKQPETNTAKGGVNLAERSKYQFEADSEDEASADEFDANIEFLPGAASRLNALARAMGAEVDHQNGVIHRISAKVCLTKLWNVLD